MGWKAHATSITDFNFSCTRASCHASRRGWGTLSARSLKMSVSISQPLFAPIEFLPTQRQLERMRTRQINLEPLPRRLDFAQRHRLPVRVVIDGEMVTGAEPTAITHRLRNHNLTST